MEKYGRRNKTEPNLYYRRSSGIKRLLKNGILRANKVGGRYNILGYEILRLVSPEKKTKFEKIYYRIKDKTKKTISKW